MTPWLVFIVATCLVLGLAATLYAYHRWAWTPFMKQRLESVARRPVPGAIGGEDMARKYVELFSPAGVDEQALLVRAGKVLEVCLPQGPLWEQLVTDSASEKAALAQYVVRHFFRPKLRCFVQASTTAVYLGLSLGRRDLDVLVYTNSYVFPMTVLRDNTNVRMYPFAGPIHDQRNGGWLFPPEDVDTAFELRKLFLRPRDPLSTVFLMPAAISPEGAFYRRPETAFLARLLLEHAEQVVVVAPGNRVWSDEQEVRAELRPHVATTGGWSEIKKKVSFVVAGQPLNSSMKECVSMLEEEGLQVHWIEASADEAPDPLSVPTKSRRRAAPVSRQ